VDPPRRLGWVIERDHPVIVDAVALGEVLRRDVGRKRPDVPWPEIEDVSHGWIVGGPLELIRSHPLPLAKPGPQLMRAHIAEITAKVVIRSDTDPDQLPADIYSQITEFIHSKGDILELSVEVFPLPLDLGGKASH